MAKGVVVDASPLIILAKTGFLDLLRLASDRIHVPRPVADEILSGQPNDPAVLALSTTPWLVVVDAAAPAAAVRSYGLGRGEESVITWALSQADPEVITDDLAARRCAKALGIPTRGCLGLAIVARQMGVIPSARSAVEQMRAAGLRLSQPTMNQALAIVGE